MGQKSSCYVLVGLVILLAGCSTDNSQREWADSPSPGGAYMGQTLNSSVFEDPSPARAQADLAEDIADEQERKAEAKH